MQKIHQSTQERNNPGLVHIEAEHKAQNLYHQVRSLDPRTITNGKFRDGQSKKAMNHRSGEQSFQIIPVQTQEVVKNEGNSQSEP